MVSELNANTQDLMKTQSSSRKMGSINWASFSNDHANVETGQLRTVGAVPKSATSGWRSLNSYLILGIVIFGGRMCFPCFCRSSVMR